VWQTKTSGVSGSPPSRKRSTDQESWARGRVKDIRDEAPIKDWPIPAVSGVFFRKCHDFWRCRWNVSQSCEMSISASRDHCGHRCRDRGQNAPMIPEVACRSTPSRMGEKSGSGRSGMPVLAVIIIHSSSQVGVALSAVPFVRSPGPEFRSRPSFGSWVPWASQTLSLRQSDREAGSSCFVRR